MLNQRIIKEIIGESSNNAVGKGVKAAADYLDTKYVPENIDLNSFNVFTAMLYFLIETEIYDG